ncbi:hypothetical protein UNSWDHB_845 [Dehalobacter sp. UNSWDHB]|uniref:hypothetical protein n=1 Tax=Dehalobacter sp. UNSWDHB TaxID=1339256 RepID=UPI0003878DDD|nr:hypothetical protein [Dehalobacter sp. UNSWDHB]EQB21842.1 hypothetical protein UNSWDHB_845 [Dehalobacter sp. UNSWDHB]
MKHDVTPEEKTGTVENGPPANHSLPLPEDTARCAGCPYPGVGFICWSPDGSCMRTDVERFSRRSKGR